MMAAFVTPPAPLLGTVPLPDVFGDNFVVDADVAIVEQNDGGEQAPLLVNVPELEGAIVAFGLLTPPPSPMIAHQALSGASDVGPPILGWTPAIQEGPIFLEFAYNYTEHQHAHPLDGMEDDIVGMPDIADALQEEGIAVEPDHLFVDVHQVAQGADAGAYAENDQFAFDFSWDYDEIAAFLEAMQQFYPA